MCKRFLSKTTEPIDFKLATYPHIEDINLGFYEKLEIDKIASVQKVALTSIINVSSCKLIRCKVFPEKIPEYS